MKLLIPGILILLCAFFISAQQNTKANTDQEVIYMQRSACFGSCPQYSITIYSSGKMIYIGERSVDKIGTYQNHQNNAEVKKLVKEFKKAGFFKLKNEYPSRYADLPETTIRFSNKGKTKEIKDVTGAPASLKKLEKRLDDLLQLAGWVKVE